LGQGLLEQAAFNLNFNFAINPEATTSALVATSLFTIAGLSALTASAPWVATSIDAALSVSGFAELGNKFLIQGEKDFTAGDAITLLASFNFLAASLNKVSSINRAFGAGTKMNQFLKRVQGVTAVGVGGVVGYDLIEDFSNWDNLTGIQKLTSIATLGLAVASITGGTRLIRSGGITPSLANSSTSLGSVPIFSPTQIARSIGTSVGQRFIRASDVIALGVSRGFFVSPRLQVTANAFATPILQAAKNAGVLNPDTFANQRTVSLESGGELSVTILGESTLPGFEDRTQLTDGYTLDPATGIVYNQDNSRVGEIDGLRFTQSLVATLEGLTEVSIMSMFDTAILGGGFAFVNPVRDAFIMQLHQRLGKRLGNFGNDIAKYFNTGIEAFESALDEAVKENLAQLGIGEVISATGLKRVLAVFGLEGATLDQALELLSELIDLSSEGGKAVARGIRDARKNGQSNESFLSRLKADSAIKDALFLDSIPNSYQSLLDRVASDNETTQFVRQSLMGLGHQLNFNEANMEDVIGSIYVASLARNSAGAIPASLSSLGLSLSADVQARLNEGLGMMRDLQNKASELDDELQNLMSDPS